MRDDELLTLLLRRIDEEWNEPTLPVRARNCLPKKNIIFWGDLIQIPSGYFFSVPGLGKGTLAEVDRILLEHGLFRGMEIPVKVYEKFKAHRANIIRGAS